MADSTRRHPSAIPGPAHHAGRSAQWPTALTRIAPNVVEVRGYPLDELMGRLTFGEAIYLLLRGEVPSPSIGKLFDAVLVASLDHGVTPPSTVSALNVATSGAPLKDCVAAGVLGFGARHGGDVGSCLRFLQEGLGLGRDDVPSDEAARESIATYVARGVLPPGLGHRIHTRDPRAARLLQMAHEFDLGAEYCHFIRLVERVINERPERQGQPVCINLDGAIAAVCGDLGFDPEIAAGLFIIARVPGLLAHAAEEQTRHPSLRQIDPSNHVYDGPSRRRLPDTRR
jgi:citrate synthase